MPNAAFQPVSAPIPPTPAKLSDHAHPRETILYLRSELGLTQREISQALGADERTVRRWTSDPGAHPQQRYAQRIDDMRDLAMLLSDTLPGEQTARWLRARSRLLNGERPIEILATGDYRLVRSVAERYVDGDPI